MCCWIEESLLLGVEDMSEEMSREGRELLLLYRTKIESLAR